MSSLLLESEAQLAPKLIKSLNSLQTRLVREIKLFRGQDQKEFYGGYRCCFCFRISTSEILKCKDEAVLQFVKTKIREKTMFTQTVECAILHCEMS